MLSVRTQYALIILDEISAHKGEGFPKLKLLGEKYAISIPFLEQVARDLRSANLIKSKRGPNGGYSLEKESITLYDLYKALDKKDHKYACENYDLEPMLKRLQDAMDSVDVLKKK